jgi:hypothetical protein
MNAQETMTDEEFDASFIKANPDWRKRLNNEPKCLFYDYESNIIYLRFGNPDFVVMTYMDHDDAEFEWGYEYETLQIVAIHIMPFRRFYAPRYPKLQAAYEALCRDCGEGDWKIEIPPQADSVEATTAAALADALLECARDPVPVPD